MKREAVYSVFGVVLEGMGSEDECDSFSEIPGGSLGIIDALDFEEDLVLVLLVVGSSESEEDGFDPESEE